MILSDADILLHKNAGVLEIDPFNIQRLNPASYDMTLCINGLKYLCGETGPGSGRYCRKDGYIDPFDKTSYRYDDVHWLHLHDHWQTTIRPGEFMIGAVNERTFFNGDLAGELTGKSSLARLGLMVHVTAGFGDPGWNGVYVLELFNVSGHSIRLRDNMPIAQVVFHQTGMVTVPYSQKKGSKYQNQKAGQGSKYYLND